MRWLSIGHQFWQITTILPPVSFQDINNSLYLEPIYWNLVTMAHKIIGIFIIIIKTVNKKKYVH